MRTTIVKARQTERQVTQFTMWELLDACKREFVIYNGTRNFKMLGFRGKEKAVALPKRQMLSVEEYFTLDKSSYRRYLFP